MDNLLNYIENKDLKLIADKIEANKRITPEEGLLLFKKADLPLLGLLAGIVRRRHNGQYCIFQSQFSY